MVDKAVDVGWNRQNYSRGLSASEGRVPLADSRRSAIGAQSQVLALLMAFIMALFTMLCSTMDCVRKKLQVKSELDVENPDIRLGSSRKEEFRPPSPAPAFTEADLLSSVLKRLGELEEKIDVLQAKPCEMPSEKEELLNAAVCRVDALEAELITTKKAFHEALMRQEELLAYIDGQQEAKFRKKKLCF